MLRSMALAFAAALIPSVVLPAASAQDAITGKYTGRITYVPGSTGQERSDLVELQIDTLEGKAITGTASLFYPTCREQVPVRGRLDGGTLIVFRTEKDPTGRCQVNWEFKVSGNRLDGKGRGGNATLRLSK